jgi:chromosome segregation ATPase
MSQPGTHVIAEFDPLIPQDWMMKFDTPKVDRQSLPVAAQTPSVRMEPRAPASLIDSFPGDFATPKSTAKYSERDVMQMREEIQKRSDAEVGILQNELQTLEARYQESERARNEMVVVVQEFEQTMGKMIEDSRQEKERHEIMLGKLSDEKMRSANELRTVENAFKELRMRSEELKHTIEQQRKNEQTLQQTIDTLRKDVMASEQRVEAVKSHAEKKLAEYVHPYD